MLSSIVLFAVTSTFMIPTQAVKDFNSTILSEKITCYPNEYFSIETVGNPEDGVIFMNVERKIAVDDNIVFKLRLKHNNDPPLMPIAPELNLCTLLWNEVNEPDGIQAKYMMSRAFNLDGYQCPIQKTVVKLVPWVLMKQHSFDADMDCGKYHYELTMEQCRPYVSCVPLIIADLEVIMTADYCY